MDLYFRGFCDQTSNSSSSIYSFVTAQQGNGGSSSVGGCNQFLGNHAAMVRREFEKKMIRDQILAEEAARLRRLEAEVRRDIMVERELELRRRDVDQRLTLPYALPIQERSNNYALLGQSRIGGFENEMPFQRAPQPTITEANPPSHVWKGKEKEHILLAKPDANLLGTKRKAAAPPRLGASDKKFKEELSCALCHVSATDERGLSAHLQGKKHKANATRLISQKIRKSGLDLKSNCNTKVCQNPISRLRNKNKGKSHMALANLTTLSSATTTKKEAPSVENNKFTKMEKESGKTLQKIQDDRRMNLKFWCEMCQKGANSEKVMNRHKKGKQHVFRLSKLKAE